jgi:hypothetical protein
LLLSFVALQAYDFIGNDDLHAQGVDTGVKQQVAVVSEQPTHKQRSTRHLNKLAQKLCNTHSIKTALPATLCFFHAAGSHCWQSGQ